MLAPGSRPFGRFDGQISGVDPHVRGSRFRKHRNRNRGRVDTTTLLGGADPLPAMSSSFVLERPLGITACNTEGQIAGAIS